MALIIIAFITVYLILPSLFIGFKTNFSYIKGLIPFLTQSTIFDQMTILDPKNQSLFSMVHRFFTKCIYYFFAPPMPFESMNLSARGINFIFAITSILIYLGVLLKPKKMYLKQNMPFYSNIDYALLLICVALFNLNSWMSNYILLSVAYFIIVYYLIKCRFKDNLVLILWCISCILNILTIQSILGETLAYKLCFYSPFTISALLVFLALLKIKFLRSNLLEEKFNY